MILSFEKAHAQEENYRSKDPDTLSHLAKVTIAAFAGPSAAGKNYQMSRSEFPAAGTITTREARENDVNYRYLSMVSMLKAIEQGTLVQYAAVPQTRTIYGTDKDDYEDEGIHVMDVLIGSVDGLEKKGFGAIRPIGVVAYPEDWERRLAGRFKGMDQDFIKGRLDEAEVCLEVMIASWAPKSDHLMIVSSENHNHHNPSKVREFIHSGQGGDNTEAAEIARLMLATIPSLKAKYLNTGVTS